MPAVEPDIGFPCPSRATRTRSSRCRRPRDALPHPLLPLREPGERTKCIGPLEVDSDGKINAVDPDIRVRPLTGPGHVVLCTDGLWNYFPSAPEIAVLVRSAGEGAGAAAIARVLVNHALAKGGGDNVSVAVSAFT